MSEQLGYKVRTAYPAQFGDDTVTLCRIIPEKELTLRLLLSVGAGGIDRLHGVWVDTGIEYLGTQGHGGGRKVLNLLQLEVKAFGDDG